MLDAAGAVALTSRIMAKRFGEADAVFAAGSIVRGAGMPHSDIDLVVLYPEVARAWRESFTAEGTPVEAFVHDATTVRHFMQSDAEGGRPVMLRMLADGVVLGTRTEVAEALKAEAAALLQRGPVPLKSEALDVMRYRVTDMLVDLRDARPANEIRAIGAALYLEAADLILRGHGRWTGSGKWMPRALGELSPALAARFDAAFAELLGHARPEAVTRLLEDELAKLGGPLFDGYRQLAPERR